MRILNAKNERPSDDGIRMLAEIEVHPKTREWNTGVLTDDVEKIYGLFKKFFDELPTNEQQTFLVAEAHKRIVGFAGIYRKSGPLSHVGTVGISVHPDCQRRGIGTKLLKTLVALAEKQNLRRLEADTLANNEPMRRLARKFGFRLEGVRRMRIRWNGEYLDETLLALTLS